MQFLQQDIAAEDKELDGIRIRVATPAALYRLKRDAVRPLDRQDAELLRQRVRLSETGDSE